MAFSYQYPRNLIPKFFLMQRHRYVRSILKNNAVLDLGCNRYKILSKAMSLDCDSLVNPDYVGSALNLPFSDRSFDAITALELIEHFTAKNQDRFLAEVFRVLKRHGQFILSTPNISESTRAIHDFLFFVSHAVYAPKDLHVHLGELTHSQLQHKLLSHHFHIIREKAFSIFNYVVECEKL